MFCDSDRSTRIMKASTAVLLLLVCGVTSFKLTIQPHSLTVSDRANITIMCRATEELSDCQFNWWDLDDDYIPNLKFDFHQGMESDSAYLVNGSELDWRLAGYRYVGDGLRSGQCGIQLFGVKVERYRMISCRARKLETGWQYAYMTIRATGNVSTELGFSPWEQTKVVVPGDTLRVWSWTEDNTPIRSCSFRFNMKDPICITNLSPRHSRSTKNAGSRRGNNTTRRPQEAAGTRIGTCGPETRPSINDTWTRFGTPPFNCGIKMKNVTEKLNGLVYFEAWTQAGGYDRRVFHLTVAETPTNCTLQVEPKSAVTEGELIHATCFVSKSRPMANITWYMGDEMLRQDSIDDSSSENQNDTPWRWAHGEYPFSQSVVRPAKREWNGRQIKCVVTHEALAEPIVLTQVVSVGGVIGSETRSTCPPLPHENGVVQECQLENTRVDCFSPMLPGSELKMISQCMDGTPSRQSIARCQSSGMWDKSPLTCKPGVLATESTVSCPAVPSESGVLQECQLGNTPVDCSRPMLPRSALKMTSRCGGGTPSRQSIARCLSSGMWDKSPLRCNSGCGTVRPGVQPTNEQAVVQGQFPWQVAIYQLKEGKYEQVCSGSLLSMTTILTAASCFVRNAHSARKFNSSQYMVAANKLHRSWEVEDQLVQKRQLHSLSVLQHFSGVSSSFNGNLAILKVTEPFDQTENVSPVCIDLDVDQTKQLNFLAEKVGYVPGWGFVEVEQQGAVLKAVALPYVKYEQCYNLLEPSAGDLATPDSFCAGTSQDYHGYTVCSTDQGAGLVFLDPTANKYYINGVASVTFKPLSNKEVCYPASLLNFATFATFPEWVQENLS